MSEYETVEKVTVNLDGHKVETMKRRWMEPEEVLSKSDPAKDWKRIAVLVDRYRIKKIGGGQIQLAYKTISTETIAEVKAAKQDILTYLGIADAISEAKVDRMMANVEIDKKELKKKRMMYAAGF